MKQTWQEIEDYKRGYVTRDQLSKTARAILLIGANHNAQH